MESPRVLLEAAVSQIRVNQDAQEQHKILHGHLDAGYRARPRAELGGCREAVEGVPRRRHHRPRRVAGPQEDAQRQQEPLHCLPGIYLATKFGKMLFFKA